MTARDFSIAIALCLAASTAAGQGLTTRASVDSAGAEGNQWSSTPSASFDAEVIAFESGATNLVANDLNGKADVFVRRRATGVTERVSVTISGSEANGQSAAPAMSEDGSVVAFHSAAFNLVPNDFNTHVDVFVRDLRAGTTELISVTPSGASGNGMSTSPSVSREGRYVAFFSFAADLVPNDVNGVLDVFVYDRYAKRMERVSVSSLGGAGNGESYQPFISSSGQFVAFSSVASNLVPGDTNGAQDVFVHDRLSKITERVSVDNAGNQALGQSEGRPSMDRDGRFVAFLSHANNLVANDTNGMADIFVRDRKNGLTERVSISSGGQQTNHFSYGPTLSTFGRYVAFTSFSSNLVLGDTNNMSDVFIRDRMMNSTRRYSLTSSNTQAAVGGERGHLSPSGLYVAFDSLSSDYVTSDTNGARDVFLRYTDLRDTQRLP